jgi:hypothetical protein
MLTGIESVPTNKPKITFVASEEMQKALEAWALEEDRSVSNLVKRIVQKALDDRQKG